MNVIDEMTFNSLFPKPELAKCNTSHYPYEVGVTTPFAIIDQFTGRVWYRDKKGQAGFVVVKGKEECLMSYRTAKTLGLINMDENHLSATQNE